MRGQQGMWDVKGHAGGAQVIWKVNRSTGHERGQQGI